jgi:purine nucleosidase
MTTPLILDVDTGIDDSLALLYAAASPEAELALVTTVAGNVHLDDVTANTLAVLELAGRGDVPVVAGAAAPLVKPLTITPETHGPHGIGHAVRPVAARAPEPGLTAARAIVDAVAARPGELTLVTLGPMTNLALALELDPDLPARLRGWTFMGGAFAVPGNTTPTAEWNLHVDPDAAKVCLAAWAEAIARDPAVPPPLGMGLDVTERARILPADVAALARRAGGAIPDDRLTLEGPTGPVVRLVVDALRFYFEFHDTYDGFFGAFIHDPFAVAATLDRGLVRTEAWFVDVEAGPGLAHGMTVADRRRTTGRSPNVEVAVEGDAARFLERLVDRVGGLAGGLAGRR